MENYFEVLEWKSVSKEQDLLVRKLFGDISSSKETVDGATIRMCERNENGLLSHNVSKGKKRKAVRKDECQFNNGTKQEEKNKLGEEDFQDDTSSLNINSKPSESTFEYESNSPEEEAKGKKRKQQRKKKRKKLIDQERTDESKYLRSLKSLEDVETGNGNIGRKPRQETERKKKRKELIDRERSSESKLRHKLKKLKEPEAGNGNIRRDPRQENEHVNPVEDRVIIENNSFRHWEKPRHTEGVDTSSRTKPNLQEKMKKSLESSRFRWINEQLYTTTGNEALKMFSKDRNLFDIYHRGFTNQVKLWPVNPVNIIIDWLKKRYSIRRENVCYVQAPLQQEKFHNSQPTLFSFIGIL